MSREFDIVVYGASGYTGRLVAEYLVGSGSGIKWAMAGRSEAKLAEVGDVINAPKSTPLLVADAGDVTALKALAARTRVVLTTAGPYQLYGDELVAACASEGTDYVDLTGEPNWIAKMIGLHEAAAKQSGARLVFSCGFDSVPFDLGVYFIEREAKKRFGEYAPRVRGRVRAINGGLSGGTMASGTATAAAVKKDRSVALVLMDPFALTPGFKGPAQPDLNASYEDKITGSWVVPFMMAGINTKAVHRSNFLLGHVWGKDFVYDEMMMTKGPGNAQGAGFSTGRPLKPGEGPSRAERDAGFYDLLFIAQYPDGRMLRGSVKGDRDPGYGSTSKIISESAICLARDVDRAQTPGGCWTPTAAMGEALMKRLETRAGLTFTVES
ncbi:MAG: saccharopine dehydrogenase NADP-binding domain-containing protein [Micropepsaceae bacterium]